MDVAHGKTGNHFLDSLDAGIFGLLKPYLAEVNFSRGETLCQPGTDIDCVWFPTTATLSVVTIMEDGRDVEACTIGHESACGLLHALGSATAIDRVIAQVPGKSIKLPSFRLRSAAPLSLAMTDLVIRHAQANVAQVQQSVACNAIHTVEERLCRWLLMTQDRTRADRLPLTQEFLGFMLGVQRTTVTGAARGLQAGGLIRYSRGTIEISRPQGRLLRMLSFRARKARAVAWREELQRDGFVRLRAPRGQTNTSDRAIGVPFDLLMR
jgi:CRP-like cAMP-binding protein